MCSYMAMFPPKMPRVFIDWLTQPGDVCYDPFAGRGTLGLEACTSGRIGYLSDANPLAWVLSSAKVDPPIMSSINRRISALEREIVLGDVAEQPEHIRILFSDRTLAQLLWLRAELDTRRRVDRYILAVLLGVLHARADSSGRPAGLTVAMPNTFSMSPNYIGQYVRTHELQPPDVNVFDVLRRRLARFAPLPSSDHVRGQAWLHDATKPNSGPVADRRAKLIFSSPPYLEVMRYGKLNWIRLWLLNHEPSTVDAALFSSGSVSRYLEFIRPAVHRMREVLRDDGYVALVIGDVRRDEREIDLAAEVAAVCTKGTDMTVLGTIADALPVEHKVSRIWGGRKGQATKTDRILILGGPDALVLPHLPSMSWT
jgi:DNA methylase